MMFSIYVFVDHHNIWCCHEECMFMNKDLILYQRNILLVLLGILQQIVLFKDQHKEVEELKMEGL